MASFRLIRWCYIQVSPFRYPDSSSRSECKSQKPSSKALLLKSQRETPSNIPLFYLDRCFQPSDPHQSLYHSSSHRSWPAKHFILDVDHCYRRQKLCLGQKEGQRSQQTGVPTPKYDIMKLICEIKGPIIGGRLGLFISPSAPPIITNEVRPPTTRLHLPHPPY